MVIGTQTDRLTGTESSVAVKAPCKAYTTAALTQSGEQTIGGVACVDGDRYLRNVSPADTSNGIWIVRESAHERAKDFDSNRDVVQGTKVLIATSSSSANEYRVTTTNPITIGSTAIEFVVSGVNDPANNPLYAITAAEMAAGVTIVSAYYPPCCPNRYGTNTTPGTTDMTAAVQAACTVAYNSNGNGQQFITPLSESYVLSSPVIANCGIVGVGPFLENTGTVFKWTGSGDKIFHFTTYVSGWLFQGFRINANTVTTDVTHMYFALGLVGARFVDIELRGYHTGPSFGGTYANHDGIFVVGGVAPSTKYDMANNIFDHVYFTRLRNGLTVTDPSGQGPGSSLVFQGCFSWCNGWTVKLPGANNVFDNFESVTEAGHHSFVQTGQFAVGWVYDGCDYGTAASGAGNQIIYADTVGGGSFATIIGGTLQNSQGGGVPGLVRDAGATGGKVLRYLAYGINNYDGSVLRVDQLYIGQSLAGNSPFHLEDTPPWTPAFTGLNVVLGGGSVTYTGKLTKTGNIVFGSVLIQPAGGATVESVAGTTRVNNLTYNQSGIATNCTASNAGTLASYGVGQGAVGGKNMFTPTWPAVSNGVIISFWYFTDGTT